MMNLGKKILLAYLSFIIVPLIFLGTVTFVLSQSLIERKYGEQTQLTLQSMATNLSFVLSEWNKFSHSAIVSDSVQNIVRNNVIGSTSTPEGKPIISDEAFLYLNEAEKNLRATFLSHPAIISAQLYTNLGTAFRATRTGYNAVSFIPYMDLKKLPLYQDVERLNGLPVWLGPHESAEISSNPNVLTQVRIVKDRYTLENRGLLLFQANADELFPIFSPSSLDNGVKQTRFMLVNAEGVVLFDKDRKLVGQNIRDHIGKQLKFEQNYDSLKMKFDGVESVVSMYRPDMHSLGVNDWSIVSVTSWKYLSGDTVTIVRWVSFILVLSLICALLFNLVFIKGVVRNIIAVVRAMRRVEDGDLDIRVKELGKDESILLTKGFNSLVARISDLIHEVKREQERKNRAELMLLQAQIQPHFLFNTLESINVLAIQNEGRKVSQMVYRLGKILRISIHGSEEIRIKDELDHLTSYMEIQKFRFEDLFDYEIDIPDELLESKILKLTLQPLVENSIAHGFEGIEYKGHIKIRAIREGDGIAIFVEDNGLGMSDVDLQKLNGNQQDQQKRKERDLGQRGLGMGNVADRLRIKYGSPYGMMVCSHPGDGTTVKCFIPKTIVEETP